MSDQALPPDAHAAERRPFQYSLRTLFLLTTVAAVECSVLFASRGLVRFFGSLSLAVLLPVILTVVLIYGRGYARTFAIGALFSAGPLFVSATILCCVMAFTMAMDAAEGASAPPGGGIELFVATFTGIGSLVAASQILSLVAGLLAVGVRWLVEPPRKPR